MHFNYILFIPFFSIRNNLLKNICPEYYSKLVDIIECLLINNSLLFRIECIESWIVCLYSNNRKYNNLILINFRPSFYTSLFHANDKSNDPQLHLDRKGDDYSGGSVASGSSGFGSLPRKHRPSVLSSGDCHLGGILTDCSLSYPFACLVFYYEL